MGWINARAGSRATGRLLPDIRVLFSQACPPSTQLAIGHGHLIIDEKKLRLLVCQSKETLAAAAVPGGGGP